MFFNTVKRIRKILRNYSDIIPRRKTVGRINLLYAMKTYFFDQYGLRFSPSFLVFMKKHICNLPTYEQSEFVDMITYEKVKAGRIVFKERYDATKHGLTTTAVGNLAFVTLNHPDYEQREIAKQILKQLKK